MGNQFIEVLRNHRHFHPVVPFNQGRDRLLQIDFTSENRGISGQMLSDTKAFSSYISRQLTHTGARYGIGGYNEHRTIYDRAELVDTDHAEVAVSRVGVHGYSDAYLQTEPMILEEHTGTSFFMPGDELPVRRLHLGIDIWGPLHTHVMAPLDGIVHSFDFHHTPGHYGAVIILVHQLAGHTFYTLYGHLSYGSIMNLREGQRIEAGDVFAEFGMPRDNGWWPPHLHFQIIRDMSGWRGDYPGVCAYEERDQWLANSPDPDLILNMMQAVRQ